MREPVDDPRAEKLHQGMEALALQSDADIRGRLLAYLDLLTKWNRAYNLSAIRDPMQMVQQHLLDCLAVVPALDRFLPSSGATLLDVGSGGGLPGAVLALMRPKWTVCCVDAVAKKAGFVRQVAAELPVRNLRAEHARVELLRRSPSDVVVSRAFAALADFTNLTRGQVAPGGCWLAMKGRTPTEEIAALPGNVEVFHVEPMQVPGLDAQRCLVWMRPL